MIRRVRRPGRRWAITLAALASLIVGYYLGQHWQRQQLAGLAAVVYPSGRPIDYPAVLRGVEQTPPVWRLFLVADTRLPACRALLRHYALVVNRLAAWPDIQARLRVTLLAYDHPDEAAIDAFLGGVEWAEVVAAPAEQLEPLSAQLGIPPVPGDWCAVRHADAALVAPDRRVWALFPWQPAAIMARELHTVISFVE